MATTPVEFKAQSGLTLTLELYPYGSDTIANTGGDAATEATNRKGLYSANVTEALTGWHQAFILSGSVVLWVYDVFLADDTSIHRCFDRGQDLNQETLLQVDQLGTQAKADVNAEADTALSDYDAIIPADLPTNFADLAITETTGLVSVGTNSDKSGYSISGTIQTLDGLDTAQDLQHATTQAAVAAIPAPPTADSVADAVWTEAIADHSGTAGSTAEALNAAGAAGDPWTTVLPGAYGAGSAGSIIGNLNDLSTDDIDARLAAIGLDTVWTDLATVEGTVDAIKAVTDLIPDAGAMSSIGTVANQITIASYIDTEVAAIVAELTAIKGATFNTATDSLEAIRNATLDAASVRSAIGLASANLDTQIATLATQESVDVIDGIVDQVLIDTATTIPGLIAAITTLDAAGVRSAVGLAAANLDTQLSTIVADTNEVQADLADGGRIDLLIDAILQDTSTSIPAAIPSASAIATSVHSTQMTEDYPAIGTAPTLEQALMLILQGLLERSVSGTTETVKKLDGATTAATFELDDATSPTSKTRAT